MSVSLLKTSAPEIERVDISHLRDAITDLDTVRSHMAALKEEEAMLIAAIKEAIGPTGRIGTVDNEDAIRLDERTNSHLDREAVKSILSPEAYASVLKLTPYVATVIVGKFKASRK